MGDENTHACREPPFEAAVYNLKAEAQKLKQFKSNSRAELIVEVEQSLEHQSEKKKEHSSLELPVDFSKEDVSKVRLIWVALEYKVLQHIADLSF